MYWLTAKLGQLETRHNMGMLSWCTQISWITRNNMDCPDLAYGGIKFGKHKCKQLRSEIHSENFHTPTGELVHAFQLSPDYIQMTSYKSYITRHAKNPISLFEASNHWLVDAKISTRLPVNHSNRLGVLLHCFTNGPQINGNYDQGWSQFVQLKRNWYSTGISRLVFSLATS